MNKDNGVSKEVTRQIYKETFVSKTANLIASIMVGVPMVAIWVGAFYFGVSRGLFLKMSSNMRGIIFGVIIIVPIIAAAFIVPILKNWLSQRMLK